MKIKYKFIELNINGPAESFSPDKIPVIFLHGFTGYAGEWDEITQRLNDKYLPLAVDLPGHGSSDMPEIVSYYYEDSLIGQLKTVIRELGFDKIVLAGYSMGGRLALSFAIQYPQMISALILESSTAGLESLEQREDRIASDSKLADQILKNGMDDFINYWMELPLFSSLKNNSRVDYESLLQIKRKNNPIGLSNMLRGFSTGKMISKWDKLEHMKIKTLLITGALDVKFTEISARMNNLLQLSEHKIIKETGHNVHLENPEEFFILVSEFLKNINK